jgi:hypothetical protein
LWWQCLKALSKRHIFIIDCQLATKFINPKKSIELILMPQSVSRRFLRGQTERSVEDEIRGKSTDLISFKRKNVHGSKLAVPLCHELRRSKDSLADLWRYLIGASKQAKIVGNLPPKSTLKPFSANLFRPKNAVVGKSAKHIPQTDRKNHGSYSIVDNAELHENVISGYFSSLIGKRNKYKAKTPSRFREKSQNLEGLTRLSHAAELRLFQTLENQSLPFLELHIRVGVSKRAMRGFVSRGLLTELWGKNSVGMRYKLSSKGKAHLNELQTAAEYESSSREKGLIRLKNRLP